ncbi:MAG: DUF5011 domain-containing protein [Oscillospiraceae bacterium]|nr:DUF5011 domain-containing protein [Oscillospiraceae bacterium]
MMKAHEKSLQTAKQHRIWAILAAVLGVVLLTLLGMVWLIPAADKTPKSVPSGEAVKATTSSVPKPFSTHLELPTSISLLHPVLPVTNEVTLNDLVTGLEGTGVSATLMAQPAAALGEQDIALLFTADGASCVRHTTCYRFEMIQTVVVDVAEGRSANARDFVADKNVQASLPEQITLDTLGERAVKLICANKEYSVRYIVKESDPPRGTGRNVTAEIGTIPEPETLVECIEDASQVTVTYKKTPELVIAEVYRVVLILTDVWGNASEVEAFINVIPASDAPQFTGMEEMVIQLGDSIFFKEGVSAVDPQDGAVRFTVDAAGVDRNKLGTYTAYYSAADSDGNVTIVPRTIVVQGTPASVVESYAHSVLETIIQPDMTQDQKISAVYQYTASSIQYVGSSDKESIWSSAYQGFTTGKGDCYTYYAINKILLDLLEIENVEVKRVGGSSNHWWNLVQHQDGLYYHVDSCPVAVKVDSVNHGKMTASDLQVYTNDERVAARRPNFYVYDPDLPEYQDLLIAP